MRKPVQHNFVLYDITGVHELAVDFCGCDLKVDWNIQALRASWWPATSGVQAFPNSQLPQKALGVQLSTRT
jgi:hypothetical protein